MKRILILGIIIILMGTFMISVYADEDVAQPAEEAVPVAAEANVTESETNAEESDNQSQPINFKKFGVYAGILIVLFLGALIYMTGLGSIRILLANLISGAIVWVFFTKALMWGWNKTFIVISTTLLLIISNLILLKGVNKKSLITFIGCSISILFVGLTSLALIYLAKCFEIGKEALSLKNLWIFDFNYVYLSIVITIISVLGICLEVGYSISSYLFENKKNNDDMKLSDLIKESKKHAKTIVNSKMNILLFNTLCIMNIIFIFLKITSIVKLNEYEIYAQISTLFVCETLGILFTILSTAFSFWVLYSKRTEYRKKSANIVEGKRSLKI